MDPDVRMATPRDAVVVSEILGEAALWIRKTHKPLWNLSQLTVEQVIPDCEAGHFFLAWSDRVAVGTMRLTNSDPDFWPNASQGEAVYLHRLAVRRSAAGGGVSTALLRHAASVATERGAPFLRLDAESTRSRLRGVYERFGFTFHSFHTVRGVHVARYQLEASHAAQRAP